MKILGIETSCDECSASVVEGEPESSLQVLSLSTFSQIDIHKPFGGVVPEVASRNHLETINQMIDTALQEAKTELEQIDALAVTNRPGLVGALLVGVSAAKTLAYAHSKPLVAVHHLEGHAASLFLERDPSEVTYPLLMAIVSGGHTNLYVIPAPPHQWTPDFLHTALVGQSIDDAAGEAFDKTAKTLGFPYPGGVWIDQHAQNGNPKAFALPRALPQKATLNFSFSGLKTATALKAKQLKEEGQLEERLDDLCASVQEAIVDALFSKIQIALRRYHCRSLAVVGGVASNSRLRQRLGELQVPVLFPSPQYCTDNAAMIAACGLFQFARGEEVPSDQRLTLTASAHGVPSK